MGDAQNQTYSFGTWLRRQRKARDWTQAELAQRVGCTLNMIAKIEIDARRPSRALATRLALALEIPQAEIAAVVEAARGVLAVDRLPPPSRPVSAAPPPAGGAEAPQRHQMRSVVPDFVGQQDALTALLTCLRRATDGSVAAICGIRGMGGIGKTELAYLAASHLRDTFPDAQIVVDLRGAGTAPLTPGQAVQQVLHALTPNLALPDDLETLQRHYRSVLHGQRVLILADDARGSAQVRPLIPPPGSALLVTSRMRFALPGMTILDLEVLRVDESATLLCDLCPRLGYTEAQTIAQACGHLPLALRASGGILQNDPALSVTHYTQQLADECQRLTLLRDPDDPHLDVAASLALSYDQLDPAAQMVFRQLGVIVANFATPLAQFMVVLGTEGQITDILHSLLRRNLIMYDVVRERWQLHDLARDLARQHLEVAGDRFAAEARYAQAAIQMAQALSQQYQAGNVSTVSTLAQFDTERPHIDAGQRWAAAHAGNPECDRLLLDAALATISFETLRYNTQRERIPLWERALAAAQRLGDRRAQGQILNRQGIVVVELGEARRAITYYEQAVTIARDLDDRLLEAISLGHLGTAYVDLGNTRQAITYLEQAVTIFHALGNHRLEAISLNNLGSAYAMLGESRHAITYYEHYLAFARTFGDRRREGIALHSLGEVYTDLGDQQRASEFCQHAIAIFQALGDQRREGIALSTLAYACADQSDMQRAITYSERSRTILRAIGDRRQEAYALSTLAYALAQHGDVAYATSTFVQAMLLFQDVGDRWGAAKGQWRLGLALAQQDERDQALPLLRMAVAYQQEIGHTKAEEHAALLARLEAGAKFLPELYSQQNQWAIGDNSEVALEDNAQP